MSCIYHFSLIACKQNALFGNFRRKIMSDSLFSAFSVRRLRATDIFRYFQDCLTSHSGDSLCNEHVQLKAIQTDLPPIYLSAYLYNQSLLFVYRSQCKNRISLICDTYPFLLYRELTASRRKVPIIDFHPLAEMGKQVA